MSTTYGRGIVAFIVLLLVVGTAGEAQAGGVEVQDHGRIQGTSNAGARAIANDATTVWWNPAGMTRFCRHSASLAAHYIIPGADFVDEGSFRIPPPTLVGLTGEPGRADTGVPAGGLFGVWSLNPRLKLGLGVNAPFGLTTDYGQTWIGRYHTTKSALLTININPGLAYRINRCWSVGAGLNVMYAEAELSNAIDFGALAGNPQALDGQVKMEGDSWGFGFNAGILFEPSKRTRIGLHYRSRVKQDVEGTAEFEVPAAASPIAAATGRFTNTGATTDITFPDSAGLGVYQRLNRCWALVAGAKWMGWSTWDELRVRMANPAEPDSVTVFNWEDSWRLSVGAIFEPNPCWTLRAGVAWDQSPIPDLNRTPRIPGNDRIWISAGVGYRFNRCWSLDLHYTHVIVDDAPIDQASQAAGRLFGHMEAAVDVVGLQLNFDF